MKRLILCVPALAFFTAQPIAQTQSVRPDQPAQKNVATLTPIRTMLDTYCIGCHSATAKAGGVVFAGMSLDTIGANAEVWEKTVRKLRGRLMPPPGSRQPEQAEVDVFVRSLEDALDNVADRPVAGHVPIQRLTRTEYGIAVKDLLGVEIDAENLLPTEIEVGGFDNIAAALSISPSFLDQCGPQQRCGASTQQVIPEAAAISIAIGDAKRHRCRASTPMNRSSLILSQEQMFFT